MVSRLPLQVMVSRSDLEPIEYARPGVPYNVTINARDRL